MSIVLDLDRGKKTNEREFYKMIKDIDFDSVDQRDVLTREVSSVVLERNIGNIWWWALKLKNGRYCTLYAVNTANNWKMGDVGMIETFDTRLGALSDIPDSIDIN